MMNQRARAFTVIEFLVVLAIIAVLAGMIGLDVMLETPFRLVFGWLYFLARKLPLVTWSGEGITMFAILIMAITVLAYVLALRWWGRDFNQAISYSTPFFAVLLVVAVFVAGIGASGVAHQVGWLISSPEPWVGSGSGTVVYRIRDQNVLKQIGLALHLSNQSLAEQDKTLLMQAPTFAQSTLRSPEGMLLHGWHTSLLPHLEQQVLFEKIDSSRAWNDPVNRMAMGTKVNVFLRQENPSDPLPEMSGSYALSHVAGNRLLFGDAHLRCLEDITDGMSTTVFAGNAAGQFLPWGHPLGWRGSEFTPNQDDRGFGSGFYGGCQVCMADGSVKFITDSIDRELWNSLFTPRGGESIDDQF